MIVMSKFNCLTREKWSPEKTKWCREKHEQHEQALVIDEIKRPPIHLDFTPVGTEHVHLEPEAVHLEPEAVHLEPEAVHLEPEAVEHSNPSDTVEVYNIAGIEFTQTQALISISSALATIALIVM